MSEPDAWRTPQFRQRVIKSIEDTVTNSGGGISPRPPADMENQAFQKAKSKEEYLNLVSKVIVYVRESANQKKQAMGMGGGMQGMPQQDPINALQTMAKVPGGAGAQGMGHPGQGGMGGMGMGVPGPSGGGGMMAARGAPAAYGQYGPPGAMQPGPHRPMGPVMHGAPGYGQPGMGQPNMGQPSMGQPNMMGQPGMGPQYGPMGGMRPSQAPNQYAPPGLPFSTGPSPAAMSHSPAMMPSPSHVAITPSPGPRAQVPSPASVTLNTPQSTMAQSPADGKSEELVYLEKLKELQKFVEPLKRVINKIENDNNRQKDHNKMKNLLNILTDPNKRVPMDTLIKCQNVLEKLHLDFMVPTPDMPTMIKPGQHMCQNLINRIAAHIKQPMFNHTLHRTFGPAVHALHGEPIRAPSPPRKRRRNDSESRGGDGSAQDEGGVSDLLQGEIARLHHKFSVDLDPLYHNQSKAVHLICKLDDKNLPSVPPIAITVPENYPHTSPTCLTATTGYDATPFLQGVDKSLTSHLQNMPGRYSVTALLNIWEMSVRKAGAFASPSA